MKQSDCKNRFPIFKERLEKLMGDMSNTEFAAFLGMSRQTVGFYLNGERIPNILDLKKIAEKCNVSADYLLGLSDAPERTCPATQIANTTGLDIEIVKDILRKKDNSYWAFINNLFAEKYTIALFFSYLYKLNCTSWSVSAWNELCKSVDEKYFEEHNITLDDLFDNDDDHTHADAIHNLCLEALRNIIESEDTPKDAPVLSSLQTILHIQESKQYDFLDYDCRGLCDMDRARVLFYFNEIMNSVDLTSDLFTD